MYVKIKKITLFKSKYYIIKLHFCERALCYLAMPLRLPSTTISLCFVMKTLKHELLCQLSLYNSSVLSVLLTMYLHEVNTLTVNLYLVFMQY